MTGKLYVKEIAAQSGVSVSTVSRILAGKSNSKLVVKQKVLAYAKAQGVLAEMAQGPLLFNQVMIFAPSRSFDVRTDIFYYNIIQSIREAVAESEVRISYCPIEEVDSDVPLFLKKISDPACECAILLGIDDPLIHEIAADIGKPCVLVNAQSASMHLDSVSPNHHLIGEFSANYLFEQGHRDILVLICLCRITLENRLQGIRKAFETNNVPFDDARQLVVTTGFGMEESHELVRAYLTEHAPASWPTAILASGDFMATGAAQAVEAQGLSIPGDLSVMSMDSLNLTEISNIPLTAVRVPRNELGQAALRLLQQRLACPQNPHCSLLLHGHLVVQNSVKRLAKGKRNQKLPGKSYNFY